MSKNKIKETDIKNRMYYFFDDMINIKSLDPNKMKIDQKSYKNILIYYISYVTSNSVKPLYLIINNEMGTLMNIMNKYLTLPHTDKDKDTL